MKIIKYLIHCLLHAFSLATGGGPSPKADLKMNIVSILLFIVIAFIDLFFWLKIFKGTKLKGLWAFLSTLGVLLVFCGICIFVEWLIKLF